MICQSGLKVSDCMSEKMGWVKNSGWIKEKPDFEPPRYAANGQPAPTIVYLELARSCTYHTLRSYFDYTQYWVRFASPLP